MNKKKQMKLLIVVLVVSLFLMESNGSILYINGTTVQVRTPYMHRTPVPLPYNVTSYLIPIDTNIQNCTMADPALAPFMKGAIVIVAPDGGCSVNHHALLAQDQGAAAVLVVTFNPFIFASNVQSSPSRSLIQVPVIFIDLKDFENYVIPSLVKNEVVLMTVTGDRVNKKKFIFFSNPNLIFRCNLFFQSKFQIKKKE